MSEFDQQQTARKLEITVQAVLQAAMPTVAFRRTLEAVENILPVGVINARITGEDLSFKYDERYAHTLELRVIARHSVAAPDSGRSVEAFASNIKTAVEAATGVTGWNYLRLEYQGDERANDSTRREVTNIWTVTAHAE